VTTKGPGHDRNAAVRAVESSLSYRAGAWVVAAAGSSLVGRFFIAAARIIPRVFVESRVFGLRHVGSHRLERGGHPWSVLLISRPYLWLREAVERSAMGRTKRAAADPVEGAGGVRRSLVAFSGFGGGAWVLPVAAGFFALGCARLAVSTPGPRLVTPAALVVIGALMFAAGPRLMPATRASLVVRGARWLGAKVVEGTLPVQVETSRGGGPRAATVRAKASLPGAAVPVPTMVLERPFSWRRLVGPLGLGVALAVAAGSLGGSTHGSGPGVLAALVAAGCLLVLVFWRPEVMLLAVAAFPWIDWGARRVLGGFGPAWDDAFLLLSIVVLLWCVIVLRRSELWTVPIVLPILLAFAAAIGSVVVREVPGDVAVFALRVLFEPLLFYFLGFLFPKDKRWVQYVVAVFLAASVALALHGLYQYATHVPMPAHWVDVHEADIRTRAYSIIENPNGLGAFLLMGTLLSLSLALTKGLRGLQRGTMAVACVVQLAGVAVTFSRGAWLGLGAGIVVLIVMAHRRYLAPLVAAGVLGWFVAPQQFTGRLTFAFSSTYITKSLEAGRLYVWKVALQDIAAHPFFGLGLGTFGGTSAVTFGYGRLWVDNFYLQLGAEGGLILLVLFLWILLRAAKGLVKSHGMAPDPFWRALTAGVFGSFIAVAVANMTASVWETLVVGVGFWFLAGLATSAVLQSSAAVKDGKSTDIRAGEGPLGSAGRPSRDRAGA
jgi:putative inorganic carbon (HCO3(-)) transporter